MGHKNTLSGKLRRCAGGAALALGTISLMSHPAVAAQVSDERIDEAVETALAEDTAVSVFEISVEVQKGVVTLSGAVDSLLAKIRAEDIASTYKGVRSVVNNIKVKPETDKSVEALETDVRNSLLLNPATESWEVDVEAKTNGRVILSGEVDSFQERDLAGHIAAGVAGVTDVVNTIRITVPDERTDREIQNDVEARLRWDSLVDADLITVRVDDGKVTLSGIVDSLAEVERAAHDAWVVGVQNVDESGLEVRDWENDPDQRDPEIIEKSDSAIRDAVQDALLYDPRVLSSNVEVSVDDGNVSLQGAVGSLAAKRAATSDARNTLGTYFVDNDLEVEATQKGDKKISERIREALARDSIVYERDIAVSVSAGIASLHGSVDTTYEKMRAENLAASTDGVVAVQNTLTVTDPLAMMPLSPYIEVYDPIEYSWYTIVPDQSTEMTDAEIAESIRDQLWWSPFVDRDEITVSVNNGAATLYGKVESWGERNAAVENAWEGGAQSVIDLINVRGE